MTKPTLKLKTYPQTNRTFAMNKISVERGKTNYPEHFHFKHQLAKESLELAFRLQQGIDLINDLRNGGLTLSKDQKSQFKIFRNGASYLIKQFNSLAEHVMNVEKGEFEPTPYAPYKANSDSQTVEVNNETK